MELNEWLRAYTALWETARRRGVPVKEVIAGIDEVIREAAAAGSPAWRELFGDRIPTAEELVLRVADLAALE